MSISGIPYPGAGSPLSMPFSVGASGDNVIIAGISGKQIYVISMLILPTAAVSIVFKSGSTSSGSNVAIFPPASAIGLCGTSQPTGLPLSFNPESWFRTTTNSDSLNLFLSSAVTVNGLIGYLVI